MSTGPHMTTRSGRRFYFDNPDPSPEAIILSDIDYALRHLNRFTGHVGPYNVATHSVNVLRCALELGAQPHEARAALMHDAHEAFVGDVSSPLKIAIGPAFAHIDARAARAIVIRFKLDTSVETGHIVHTADRMVTHAEALAFMGDAAKVWAVDPWPNFDPDRYQGRYEFENACEEWGIE